MAVFLPSAQALTFDSTYWAVVRERDQALRERDVARAELEMLRQSSPEIKQVLDDERKAVASVRAELLTEQRTSAKWRGIVWWGIPLGVLVGVLTGTAIGNMARRAHTKRQPENSPGQEGP